MITALVIALIVAGFGLSVIGLLGHVALVAAVVVGVLLVVAMGAAAVLTAVDPDLAA